MTSSDEDRIEEGDVVDEGGRSDADVRERALRDYEIARAKRIWPAAVAFVRDLLGADGVGKVRKFRREDPDGWWTRFHLSSGMNLRNRLREAGFGETELGIDNLDNIYVELIEEAATSKEKR